MVVPDYILPKNNVFSFRQNEWNESDIIQNIKKMLFSLEKFDITVKKISFSTPDKKTDQSEIKKTISKSLKIILSLAGGTKLINMDYQIPWLQNNYFYISGNRKIPIYQLFDMPVIVRSDMIKIRTNIQTVQMTIVPPKREKKIAAYSCNVTLFSKKIPLVHLLMAIGGNDFLNNIISGFKETLIPGPNLICLVNDITTFRSDVSIVEEKLFFKLFRGKSDVEIIENILLLTEIDIFTKQFMKTENIIYELLWAITEMDKRHAGNKESTELLDDCSVLNKRVRCIEYFVYHFLAKDFYNLAVALKRSKRDNFSNNSKVIMVNANSSPIVQYESPINPLDELARLTRLALTGPGGFKKDNIPPYLRDIHPSMFGKICPADTGDRENCGALQYIVPCMEINPDGTFGTSREKAVASISILHVPFMEHDDPTRLQMASSQMRHSIMLKEFDLPLVQSGIEGMYTSQSSFIFIADRDGKVIYKDTDIIIVQYNNGKCKAFNIGYKKSRLSIVDFYNTYYNTEEENQKIINDNIYSLIGDRELSQNNQDQIIKENSKFIYGDVQPTTFTKDSIISESNFLNHGRLTIGKNLKTCIMTWHGYNYEDAIIVSESTAKKFTSVHYLDLSFELNTDKILLNLNNTENYNPLPKMYDKLKCGDVYAKIKTIIDNPEGHNDIVFDHCSEKICDEDCTIIDIQVFVRKRNKLIRTFDDWISTMVNKQHQKRDGLINNLKHYLTKDELEQFLLDLEIDESNKEEEKFKIKGEAVDGIYFQITAIYERSLQVGDKIGNRHGNKGIISKICPDNMMPVLEGESSDVIINPLGIISRMNVGQLFELHMGQAIMNLRKEIIQKYQAGKTRIEVISVNVKSVKEKEKISNKIYKEMEKDIIQYIMQFINIVDCNPNKVYVKQMENKLAKMDLDTFIENIDESYIIQPPFESVKIEQLEEALQYTNSKYEYECFLPTENMNTINNVSFGYMYFEKLNHIAKDKMAVRSIGPYASKTNQPLHGKSRKGGQRLGEMEIWSLISHDAKHNLYEVLTCKSDSIKKRNSYISDMVQNNDLLIDTDEDHVSQSIRLFQSYIKALGINYDIDEREV